MTRVSKKGTEARDADWSELVVNIGDLPLIVLWSVQRTNQYGLEWAHARSQLGGAVQPWCWMLESLHSEGGVYLPDILGYPGVWRLAKK